MDDPHSATWPSTEAFSALRKVAADGLGVQWVLVDSDGALAHRRGGVLEAVCSSCREALFTRDGFARCDAFYAAVGGRSSEDDSSIRSERGCPLGLHARSVSLGGGRRLVASGFLTESRDDAPEGAADAAPSTAGDSGPARLGPAALRVLDALLDACQKLSAERAPNAAESLSPRMVRLEAALKRYGQSDAFVLIRGETGAGKHHAARALHDQKDPDAPFVRCRLGAIQPELIEATLFGHTRGAFTDAARASEGLLGAARFGTLVLDEVGELPERAQALLLRLLAEGRYRPLGATRERRVEARLLGTTRLDLSELVQAGALREDLYYRLDVLRLDVPALRERVEDLPSLVERLAAKQATAMPRLSDEAWRCLARYPWPGNLHELAAEVTRLSALGVSQELTPSDLSPAIAAAGGFGRRASETQTYQAKTLAEAVAELERTMIEDGLARTDGNRSHLAAALGISRTTLIQRLKRYGLSGPAQE